jgi:tetratricopeptide (TPR) repeat protein
MATRTALELTSGDLREVGPGGRRPPPLWQVPLFFLGLLSLSVVLAAHPLWLPTATDLLARDLATIRRAVRQSPAEAEAVQSLAENALARSEARPELAGEANFLMALVYLRSSEPFSEPRQGQLRLRALAHLEQAATLGVPESDQQTCFYLLGKLTLQSGGNRKRAIEFLTLALPRGAPDPGEGYALLVQALLAEPTPDLDTALRANLEQLKYGGDEERRSAARLLRAELLLKKQMRSEAFRVLEQVGATAPPAVRLRSRSLLAEGLEQDEQWLRAVNAWQEVLKDVPSEGRARVLYHLGMCHLRTEPPDLASAMAAWQDVGPDGGEEAQASALLLAELHLHRNELDAALPEFERALEKVKTAEDYHNSLLPLARVRELFELGQRKCLQSKQYDRGGPLMQLYRQVAEPGVAEERMGIIFETWANEMQARPLPATAAEVDDHKKQVRDLFAQAGRAFKEVADVDPQAVEALWRSGNCFFSAQAFKEAGEVLLRFLRTGKAGEREPEAWFAVAEAYQAQNQVEASREAYLKCMQYDASPFAARACYQIAVQAIAASRLDDAEDILTQSVNKAAANGVEREVRRKSLFTLAELLYQRRQFDKAEHHLAIALNEFPNHPDVLRLKDIFGECRRRIAWRLYEQEKDASPSARAFLRKDRLARLEEAGKVYESLADELRNREASLSDVEKQLLQKARYAVADCYFERELYLAALYRYADCTQNYAGSKEGLAAYVNMLRCYRNPRLGDAERTEATPTVESAIRVTVLRFQYIPDGHFPFPDHICTKQYWMLCLTRDSEALRLQPPPWVRR